MKFISLLATAIIAATACCNSNQKQITVVPYPNSVNVKCGQFDAKGADFNIAEGLDPKSETAICRFEQQIPRFYSFCMFIFNYFI